MAAYIDHAAYAVRDLDWHRRFFREVLGMEEEKSRVSPEGLGQVWFYGGVQLCESRETLPTGQAHHLSLVVDDPETVRRLALEWGCETDSRPGWSASARGTLARAVRSPGRRHFRPARPAPAQKLTPGHPNLFPVRNGGPDPGRYTPPALSGWPAPRSAGNTSAPVPPWHSPAPAGDDTLPDGGGRWHRTGY